MAITDLVKDTFWGLTQAHTGLGVSCPWASHLYGAISLTLPRITLPCFCNKFQVTWKPKLKFSFSAELQWAQLPAFQLQVLKNCLPRPVNKGILCILHLWRCSRDPSPKLGSLGNVGNLKGLCKNLSPPPPHPSSLPFFLKWHMILSGPNKTPMLLFMCSLLSLPCTLILYPIGNHSNV